MSLADLKEGARVIYARGAKSTLLGKRGVIKTFTFEDAHYPIAYVQFDELGTYPCWIGNLDPVPTV